MTIGSMKIAGSIPISLAWESKGRGEGENSPQSLELCKGIRKWESRMRRSRFSHRMRVGGISQPGATSVGGDFAPHARGRNSEHREL